MKHSICVIDDSIPPGTQADFIDDTKLLERNSLHYLLGNEEWADDNVKSLISQIFENENTWTINAFRNPSFYFNHVKGEILSPEIIIFDWDYDGRSDDSETYLLELLKTTYSIIHIYTNADMEGAVSAVINTDTFSNFSHRLGIIQKENENSFNELLEQVNGRYDSNFSYRFSKELKANAIKAIDHILTELSPLSLEEFVRIFGSKKRNNRYEIPTMELVSIVTGVFRYQLLKQKFSNSMESADGAVSNDLLVKKVWAYRLYHSPEDDTVRKGDIIRKSRSRGDELYMVLSSDCHINQFWKKNFGFVSLVPLHKLVTGNSKVKNRFSANNAGTLNSFKLSSLTNPSQIDGITILPGIKDANGDYQDYLLNPKEIITVQIKLPNIPNIESEKGQLALLYKYWRGYKGKDRIRVSEPFLSPLIQFIMDNITGYGCPDFPKSLQDQIKRSFDAARA